MIKSTTKSQQIKIIPRKVNAALSNCNVVANMKELYKNFVFVPIDKAVNNVAIIYRRLCASTKAKKKKKKDWAVVTVIIKDKFNYGKW